jgi:hypothetical protein
MSVLLTCYKNYFLQIKGKDVAFYFEIIKIYNHSNTNTCSSFPFLILKYVFNIINKNKKYYVYSLILNLQLS